MIELAAISSIGGGGVITRPTVEAAPQAVPAVEPSLAGQGLSSQMSSGFSQSDTGSGGGSTPQKPVDPDALTGPPPTFLLNVLEMDRDLAQALARMNAENTFPKTPAPATTETTAEADIAEREQPEVKAAEIPAEPKQAAQPEVKPEEPEAA